jgi:putative transposase
VMKKTKSLYRGHRFPAVVISCAVCWYFRFSLSLRDVEELLLERGVAQDRYRPAAQLSGGEG